MKSQFITDPLDTFPGFSDAAGFEPHMDIPPPASPDGGSLPGANPVHIPPAPALVSEAVASSSAQGSLGSTVSLTAGGIIFNLLYDAAAMAAPQSFRDAIQQAASLLTAAISDKITVNIKIDYSGTGGGAAAGPDNGLYESYSAVRVDLINYATAGDTTFNGLTSGSSIQGQSNVAVWNAQLKLWGILGSNDTTTDDGSATFATDISSGLLVGVALHELTHAIGRVPYGSAPDIFDLFRFTSPGVRLMDGGSTAPAAYFSVDGGTTKLADFGQNSDPSDLLNSGVQGGNDPFNEFYTGSTLQSLTAGDKKLLDALGFHLTSANGISLTATSAQAVEGGAAVGLLNGSPAITDAASTTLSGATIKVSAAAGNIFPGDKLFINGAQSGTVDGGRVTVSWNDSTKILTLAGVATIADYQTLLSEIGYQWTGVDSSTGAHTPHTVTWTVNDGTGSLGTTSVIAIERPPVAAVANVVLNPNAGTVAASSLLTASDPDGDVIATYAFKDTGNGHFLLNGVVQPNNQEVDVTAAQISLLTFQSAGGVDSVQARVSDGTLWSTWQTFAITGPTPTAIEAFGSTKLDLLGNIYDLDPVSGGSGPTLKIGGAAVVTGQYGRYAPIGAEQMATGYLVAFEDAGSNQFSVWSTDSDGNYLSNVIGIASGKSATLEAIETSFHQDLNGDRVIGVPPVSSSSTTIEAFGSTKLDLVGNNYYADPVSGGSGPTLKIGGAAVVTGQYGGYAPIAAEQTSTGYIVAFKDAGSNQFSVWSTDSSGSYLSNVIGIASGTSATLESIETSFHQDLNGDGVIGVPPSSSPSTKLDLVGNNYYLDPVGGGSGPTLKIGSAAVVTGQYGGYAPIAAEQTTTGYIVAFKDAGSNQFSVWSTDSNGNYLSNVIGIASGTSTALEAIETSFHQDLNGDGVIGLPASQAPLNNAPMAVATSVVADNFQFIAFANPGSDPIGPGATPHELLDLQSASVLREFLADYSKANFSVPSIDAGVHSGDHQQSESVDAGNSFSHFIIH